MIKPSSTAKLEESSNLPRHWERTLSWHVYFKTCGEAHLHAPSARARTNVPLLGSPRVLVFFVFVVAQISLEGRTTPRKLSQTLALARGTAKAPVGRGWSGTRGSITTLDTNQTPLMPRTNAPLLGSSRRLLFSSSLSFFVLCSRVGTFLGEHLARGSTTSARGGGGRRSTGQRRRRR